MLSISSEKIDSLFELLGTKEELYLPVDNKSGKADFAKWEKGVKLSSALKTVRSAKDFFFPKTENLVNYKMNGQTVEIEDPRKDLQDFVIFGVRACDAKGFDIIDEVYLKMTPVDSYYKNRRDHATVVTLACTDPAQTCFCSAYGLEAWNPAGDVTSWIAGGKFFFRANTPKGEKFIEKAKSLLTEENDSEVKKEEDSIKAKVEKLPFAHIDLSKWQGKDMMKIFNSKIWADLSQTCLGCGTCTYICPTCMCFDVRDFKSNGGIKQSRCWDSCMYSDFTQMAAANPRLTQKERFRQRFMHKLVYYPMAHNDVFSCVGCGRCLESCPIHMNVVKVIKAYNELPQDNAEGGAK